LVPVVDTGLEEWSPTSDSVQEVVFEVFQVFLWKNGSMRGVGGAMAWLLFLFHRSLKISPGGLQRSPESSGLKIAAAVRTIPAGFDLA
jgi:hypothetical protein